MHETKTFNEVVYKTINLHMYMYVYKDLQWRLENVQRMR